MRYLLLSGLVRQLISTAAVALLACVASTSRAAVTCTPISNSNAYFTYVSNTSSGSGGAAGAANVVQNTVSFSCTRTGGLTPNQVFFGVTNGLYPSGGNNRAKFSPPDSFVRYGTFKDAACSQILNDGSAMMGAGRISIPLTAALGVAQPITVVFYTCIDTAQNVTSLPAGVYIDTPNMNLRYSGGGGAGDQVALLNVNINVRGVCSVENLTPTINLTYQAFQNSAEFASGQFTARCTNLLQYTMAVSPTSGVVRGVNYQLGLSSGSGPGDATNIGPTSLNDVGGSSGTKMHYINAVMQAGQAGQVGAPLSSAHTLTITY